MKRIIAILLLCCYTISSNGIFISKHFCGGQLQTISYYKKISKCCCDDETTVMPSKDDCCDDIATFSKLTTDQNIFVGNGILVNAYFADYVLPIVYINNSLAFAKLYKVKLKTTIHPPPNIYRNPLFVQHHSWKLDC